MLRHLGAALVAALLIVACDLIAGVDDLAPKERVTACTVDADCGDAEECHELKCSYDTCVSRASLAGTACRLNGTCDGDGNCHCPGSGCANGASCNYHTDCESGYCDKGYCGPSPCGGPCGGVCMECSTENNECQPVAEGESPDGACEVGCDGEGGCPSCDDGIPNGQETGDGCGGPFCPRCADGQKCDGPADCQSCRCVAKLCVAPDCGNNQQDGCESDVDCGGPCGSTCAPGETCKEKQDCASHWCDNEICREGT